jgi:hypothetical protein
MLRIAWVVLTFMLRTSCVAVKFILRVVWVVVKFILGLGWVLMKFLLRIVWVIGCESCHAIAYEICHPPIDDILAILRGLFGPLKLMRVLASLALQGLWFLFRQCTVGIVMAVIEHIRSEVEAQRAFRAYWEQITGPLPAGQTSSYQHQGQTPSSQQQSSNVDTCSSSSQKGCSYESPSSTYHPTPPIPGPDTSAYPAPSYNTNNNSWQEQQDKQAEQTRLNGCGAQQAQIAAQQHQAAMQWQQPR